MAALVRHCNCLSSWDRRDNLHCEHDLWGNRRRRPAPTDSWSTPHRSLSLPIFLLVAATLAVLFLGGLSLGQTVMCAWHDQGLRYCPGYEQTAEVPQ